MSFFKKPKSATIEHDNEALSEISVSPKMDNFVGSPRVSSLNRSNFTPYLENKDIALVMFYKTCDEQCELAGENFSKASQTTSRPRHAYAAVDCRKSVELCNNEGIQSFPQFKMYSRGSDLKFKTDPINFLSNDMKIWVENFPVFPREDDSKCR